MFGSYEDLSKRNQVRISGTMNMKVARLIQTQRENYLSWWMIGIERWLKKYEWDRVFLAKASKAPNFIKQLLLGRFNNVYSSLVLGARI
jgi:hypothetical protein